MRKHEKGEAESVVAESQNTDGSEEPTTAPTEPTIGAEVTSPITPEHILTVREQLKLLQTGTQVNLVKMGSLLKETYLGKFWSTYGHESFDAFVETELGMKKRKALYLIGIHETYIEKLKMPVESVAKYDWSKLAEIRPVITDENKDDWLKKAETLSVREIKAAVKEERGDSSSEEGADGEVAPPVEQKSYHFTMQAGQIENVDRALLRAQAMAYPDETADSKNVSKSHLFDLICQEFNASYVEDNDGNPVLPIIDHLETIERVYGVKFDDALKEKLVEDAKKPKQNINY